MKSLLTWWLFLTVAGCSWPRFQARAADWPRLGGIDGGGISSETDLIRTWPEEGPPVLWTVDVGEGFAGPAVQGGLVFLLDRELSQRDILRCLDLHTGHERWRFAYEAPGILQYNGSRNVPTLDGNLIFTVGPMGHFHCINRQTRQVIWTKHLVNDFKDAQMDRDEPPTNRQDELARTQLPTWGMTQAPLLYQDLVIVAPQTQKTGLVAYEKTTGAIRWQSGYIGRNWYSHVSPYLTRMCGVEQVIMLAQPSDPEKAPSDAPPAIISSVDPQTGRILWSTKTSRPHKIPIAQPLRVAPDKLFITGGYGHGCLLLQVVHTENGWETKVLVQERTVAAHIHSPIFYEDRIYATSYRNQGGLQSGLVCLHPDAQPIWQTGPKLQFFDGSFLIADGLALVMNGRTGELHLFELADSGPKHLAQAKVLDAQGGQVWAPMALSDGKLLVRDQHQMKCLNLRSP